MFAKVHALPAPLKVVAWLNLIVAALGLLGGLAGVTTAPLADVLKSVGGALISILVVVGILVRSHVVRALSLVFAWLSVVLYGAALVFGLVMIGFRAVAAVIPLAAAAATVWGFASDESKKYFGIGIPEDRSVTRDWMGNPIMTKLDAAKEPNKAPEPTPTSVTPPANVPKTE